MAGSDKKLYKRFMLNCESSGNTRSHLHALAPPQSLVSLSPKKRSPHSDSDGNYLCDTISTKTLFYLVSTLNSSYNPDYDFSDSKSDEFSKEPSVMFVTKSVDSQLAPLISNYDILKNKLWTAIDSQISLADCDIYSYNPDLSGDPFGEEGTIWAFNYFFYNKKRKRIVFFACRFLSSSSDVDMVDSEMFHASDDIGYEIDDLLSPHLDDEGAADSMDCYD